MKKLTYIILIALGICSRSKAQDVPVGKDLFFVSYEIAIPSNSNYLTKTSWTGARLDYRKMVTPNLSVGAAFSFNTFEQYFEKQTYQRADGSGAVTSDMIRQIYTAPFTVNAHYYFDGGSEKFQVYSGIGLGAQYSQQDAYFNIYNIEERNWGFVVRPEFGLLTTFSPNVKGFASVAFNYATNNNDAFNINHLSHIPISIGIVFTP